MQSPKLTFACRGLAKLVQFPAFMSRLLTDQWPRKLTDWCVIQAFRKAGTPRCLQRPPALAVGFVAEVSSVIRFRGFFLREAELETILDAAAESVYERIGDAAYRDLRESTESAQEEYLRSLTRVDGCPERRARWQTCNAALNSARQGLAPAARSAQRTRAKAYWAAQRQQRLEGPLFSHLEADHPVAAVARFAPVWWQRFQCCLHREFSRRDLTQFHLLDELPRLRRRVGSKKVLAALVEEWREAHADELGLPAQLHYHVIEARGVRRARAAAEWFNSRAPGYTSDHEVATAVRGLLRIHMASLMASPDRN
jgi:hypothetical protein